MTDQSDYVNTWQQLELVAPHAVVIHLRVGIVPVDERAQIQLQVENASTGDLLAMFSKPHVHPSDIRSHLQAVLVEFYEHVDRYSGPF